MRQMPQQKAASLYSCRRLSLNFPHPSTAKPKAGVRQTKQIIQIAQCAHGAPRSPEAQHLSSVRWATISFIPC